VTWMKRSVCICFRYFNFAFLMPWIFYFENSECEANSQTELLLRPLWKNVRFNVSSMIVLQAAHF
ncbi:hypothetical protein PANDA_010497, partial [Ailuropoda melanoleuca]